MIPARFVSVKLKSQASRLTFYCISKTEVATPLALAALPGPNAMAASTVWIGIHTREVGLQISVRNQDSMNMGEVFSNLPRAFHERATIRVPHGKTGGKVGWDRIHHQHGATLVFLSQQGYQLRSRSREVNIVDIDPLFERWIELQQADHLRTAGIEVWPHSGIHEVGFSADTIDRGSSCVSCVRDLAVGKTPMAGRRYSFIFTESQDEASNRCICNTALEPVCSDV